MKTSLICCMLLFLIALPGLVSCSLEQPQISEPTAAPQTSITPETAVTPQTTLAPETTGEPAVTQFTPNPNASTVYHVTEKKLVRALLDWQHVKTTTQSGEPAFWNLSVARTMRNNVINIYPRARNENLETIKGGYLIPQYTDFLMEYTAPALKESHDMGMEVISSLPMILIERETFEAAGLKIEDYAAIYPNGKIYDGGCLNNPNWRKLIYDYTMRTAQAGFDGMFCDANPYSYGPGFNCCCQYCADAWAKFSLEKLGHEEKLLKTVPTNQTSVSRCFYDFRAKTYLDFLLLLRDDARKINPEFSMWPNTNMNNGIAAYYLLGGNEHMISEYGDVKNLESGENSTLYMFRQYEAIYEHLPMQSQYNNTKTQGYPFYKLYTAYAEALASGGSMMMPVLYAAKDLYPVLNNYNNIIDENEDAFTSSTSIAETAVVYSWRDIYTYHHKSSGQVKFAQNTSRVASSLLAANGIPFDYILPEKNTLTVNDLKQYKTIILPELHLLDQAFLNMLDTYVRNGGQLLILGKTFATNYTSENGYDYPAYDFDVFESLTGTKFSDAKDGTVYPCGSGKILVCKNYAIGTSSERTIRATAALRSSYETLDMFAPVRVTEDITGKVETTLRSDATGQHWWLHLINYNTGGEIEEKPYRVTITIPEGETVIDVIPSCAFREVEEMKFSWDFKDGLLTVSGIFDIHTMLTICKQ